MEKFGNGFIEVMWAGIILSILGEFETIDKIYGVASISAFVFMWAIGRFNLPIVDYDRLTLRLKNDDSEDTIVVIYKDGKVTIDGELSDDLMEAFTTIGEYAKVFGINATNIKITKLLKDKGITR